VTAPPRAQYDRSASYGQGGIDDVPTNVPLLTELGVTGLRRTGGYVDDEFLPQLRGRKAVQVFREMTDNSAIVAAWLNTLRQLLRQIEWRVEPASSSAEDRANAEFVEQNRDDMEHSFGDLVVEIASMCSFGWSNHEIVYKRRQGLWAKDKRFISKYTDNKIGWRKMPVRAQETLLRWVFDDDAAEPSGDAIAMVQLAPPRYQTRTLPMSKCLLFRYMPNKNNPEGYSPLRPMYRSWFMLKRFEETEAVGIERDLTGMPVAKVPSHYLDAVPPSKEAKMVAAVQKAVTQVRRNEQEGLVWPSQFDPETKQDMFGFELMTSGGTRQHNIDEIIQRYETRMLMSVLADFIMTGHEGTGASYALHTDKSGIFETGLNSIANSIAGVLNRDAIPKLFALNNIKPEALPKFVPNNVNPPDLTQLAGFMTALANAGVQWFPDPVLEAFLRDAARLPKIDEKTEKVLEVEQRQAMIISLATQKLQAIQLQQQAQQGELALQQQQVQNAAAQQQLEAGPPQQGADPGDPQGTNAKAQARESTTQASIGTSRARIGADTDKVKLAQEKQKLKTLKKPAPKSPPNKAVRKSLENPFGIDHGRAA
jgi:hypothetical protein